MLAIWMVLADDNFSTQMGVLGSIIYQGILEGGITGTYFPVHVEETVAIHLGVKTMAFATLGLIQLLHAFNAKSIHKFIFSSGVFKNKIFNYAILLALCY